jgi:hypothetical protein
MKSFQDQAAGHRVASDYFRLTPGGHDGYTSTIPPEEGEVNMPEPWVLLDHWGNPVLATALDGKECRPVRPDEIDPLLAGGDTRLAGLLAKYQEGDKIIWYDSTAADWAMGLGSQGYALIRGEYLVESVVVRMN